MDLVDKSPTVNLIVEYVSTKFKKKVITVLPASKTRKKNPILLKNRKRQSPIFNVGN